MHAQTVADTARVVGEGCRRAKGRMVWVDGRQVVEVYRRAAELQPKLNLGAEIERLAVGGINVEVSADRCADVCDVVVAAFDGEGETSAAKAAAAKAEKETKAAAAKAEKEKEAKAAKQAKAAAAKAEKEKEAEEAQANGDSQPPAE